MDLPNILNAVNTVLWVSGNVMLAYTAVVLLAFLIAYYAIFDPKATTGGRLIFRFMLSLAGVIVLVFIGIYIDPSSDNQWYNYPEGVEVWRPLLRLAVYSYVAYSITALVRLLVLRKWFPERVKKASDLDLIKVRHTSEIPVIKIIKK